jgi:hypothetical protein
MLKKKNDNGGLKTRGFDGEVFLSQGFKNQTLGGNNSLRCRNPRP